MAETKFPGPYVNETKVDRSVMEYVDFDKMDVGARASGLPKGGIKTDDLNLDHVQNRSTGSEVKNKFP